MNWLSLSLSSLTATTVLAITVLLVFTGQLIPRWVVTQIRKNYESQLKAAQQEADDWKAAYQAVNAAREVQGRQLDDLLDSAKTTDAFIRALPAASTKVEP